MTAYDKLHDALVNGAGMGNMEAQRLMSDYSERSEFSEFLRDMYKMRSKHVEALEDHIADLRNKYGRIHSYFQLLEADIEYGLDPDEQIIFDEIMNNVISDNKRFVDLLKEDV